MRGGARTGSGRKPGQPMAMFFIRVPADLKEKLSLLGPELLREELTKLVAKIKK